MLNLIMLVTLITVSGSEVNTYGDMVPAISEIPDSINKLVIPSDLEPYIKSAKKDDRVYAAIRLSQIGGDKSLKMLFDMYENEKMPASMRETFPNVKYYVLLAIGTIGGRKAEQFLMPLAKEYSAVLLPEISGRKASPGHSDSAAVINGSFKGLAKIATPQSVIFFDSLCGLENGELFIRRMACESYYKAILKSGMFINHIDSMDYLVNQYKPLANEPRWDNKKKTRPQWLKAVVLRGLLMEMGNEGADYLDRYLMQIPTDDPARSALESIRIEQRRRNVTKSILN